MNGIGKALPALGIAAAAIATGSAIAQDNGGQCDIVSVAGTGRLLLEEGRLVGTDTFSIVGTQEQIQVNWDAVILGTIGVDQESGAAVAVSSHRFSGGNVDMTTFDEVTIVPINGTDSTCTTNPCGLIYEQQVERGSGRYNCGRLISGFSQDPAAAVPFTSFVDPANPAPNGDTIVINALGKLCNCGTPQ